MKMNSERHLELKKLLPEDRITSDPTDLSYYGKDSLSHFIAMPSVVVFPVSTEEVVSLVMWARTTKVPLVPSGGRTGYAAGATATKGEVVVSFEKMNRILAISPSDLTIHVQAGVTTQAVKDAAIANDLFYPIDFAAKGSSHIGGNIATNAGGVRVIQYGSTREWVLGMTVVTGKGDVITFNGPLYKNRSGYDLHQLFIGSEGTLGFITEAWLRLSVTPSETTRVLVAVASPQQAIVLLTTLRQKGFSLGLYEYFDEASLSLVRKHKNLSHPFSKTSDGYVLLETTLTPSHHSDDLFALLSTALEEGVLEDVIVAESEAQRAAFLSIRESIPEVIATHYAPHKDDISVPVPALPKFIAELRTLLAQKLPSMRFVIFGHFGDGNLHLNFLKPDELSSQEFLAIARSTDEAVYSLIQSHGGSIAAEHGVGLLKREFLYLTRSEPELSAFREIKKIFDPDGICNPGKIFL